MEALTTLRQLQAADRPATPAEQQVLARWGGWGAQGLSQILDDDRPEFAGDRATLRELLPAADYEAARLTTINAHYTDAALVAEIWRAVENLGFESGRVLEPGCGSGTFIGLAPGGAQLTGVELDPTTAAIAGYLYPQASIRAESFAETRFPAGHFDAVVGNVPFGNVVLHDPRYNSGRLAMHNHFIVKGLELVRPGGVVAVLTSRYTMDATNPSARRAMAELGDLVTAVRLPSKAHWRAAGTEAITDLLVVRRREPNRPPADQRWIVTSPIRVPGPSGEEEVRVNEYWQLNPDHVLGSAAVEIGMHGVPGLTIAATMPLDQVSDQLRDRLAADTAAAASHGLLMSARTGEQESAVAGWVPAVAGTVDGQLVARSDGSFAVVEDGGEVPINVPRTQAGEVRALLELRDQARALIGAEAATLDDTADLDAARDRLATSWRTYVAAWGPINRYTLRSTGRVDPDTGEAIQSRVMPPAVRLVTRSTFGTVVAALEVFDDLTQTAEPASLLRHRLIVPRRPVEGVDSAADGLAVVLDRLGRVDVDEIARLMGVDRDQAIAELGDQVFQVPGPGEEWQTRAHYLSGNVREKLEAAQAAEVAEPGRWSRQVVALEQVQPEPIGAGDITARLGAVWIPDTDHERFLSELLNDRHRQVKVVQLSGSDWEVRAPSWGVEATKEWGTDRMPAHRLMSALIAQRPIVWHCSTRSRLAESHV
ncbi:methyltransferase domain-containing protein [Mangrovibacter phragmitis]|uniref:methyltransferase domain-containing protein n=1 Tax=Mangrovibacter phragmitis TaxID=1691903 RepID=UPI0038620C0B